MTRYILLLLMGLCLSPALLFAGSRVDSLKTVFYTATKPQDEQGLLAFRIAEQYRNSKFLDSALRYADLGLQLSEKGGKDRKLMYYDLAGQIHFRMGSHVLASKFFSRGLQLAREVNDEKEMALFANSAGISYSTSGNYKLGLESFLASYVYFLNQGKQKETLLAKKNIAKLYGKLFQQEKAISMLEELKEEIEQTKYYRISCRISLLLAEYYEDLHLFNKAEEEINSALIIAQDRNYIEQVSCLEYLGRIYQKTERDSLAIEYLQKGLTLAKDAKRKPLISDLLSSMGNLLIDQGKFKNGLDYYQQALGLADSTDFTRRKNIYEKLAQAYRLQNDYVSADHYGQKAKAISDEIYSVDNARRMAELEANFAFEEKRYQLHLAEMAKEKRVFWNWMMTLSVLFVLMMVSIYYYFYRLRKTALAREDARIKENEKILAVQQEVLDKNMVLIEALKKLKGEE